MVKLAKPISLAEAKVLAEKLRHFIKYNATHYGAHPGEITDAARTLEDLDAWFEELAGRNTRIQLHE